MARAGGCAPAHDHPRHHGGGQDHDDHQPAGQCPRARLRLRAGGRQGRPHPVRHRAGARPPVRPRGRRAPAQPDGRERLQDQQHLQRIRHRQCGCGSRGARQSARRAGKHRQQRHFPGACGRIDRQHCAGARLATRPQGCATHHRLHQVQHRTHLDLEARDGEDVQAPGLPLGHRDRRCRAGHSRGCHLAAQVLSRRTARL